MLSINGWEAPWSLKSVNYRPIYVLQKIPFKKIWHTGEGEYECKQFSLENSTKTDERFKCSLKIQQEQNEEIVEIVIINPVKVSSQLLCKNDFICDFYTTILYAVWCKAVSNCM